MPPRLRPALTALLAVVGSAVPVAAASAATSAPAVRLAPERVTLDAASRTCKARAASLPVGGRCRWTTTLRFELTGPIASAQLRLHRRPGSRARVRITSGGRQLGAIRRGSTLDVTKGARSTTLTVTLRSSRGPVVRFTRRGRRAPVLIVRYAKVATPTPVATAAIVPAPTPAAPPASPTSLLPQAKAGTVWVDAGDLAARATSGTAWTRMKARADGSLGTPDIADQNSDHDVDTLATALVYARTGDASYRAKAHDAILAAIGTEDGGRTLALGRNLASYVIAADLIDLTALDPSGDAQFRTWLAAVRTETLDGLTLISTHERRPNNWGTMAGASRIAVDLYLGDQADLDRAAAVLRGYLGDRSTYAGFDFGDLSWQASASTPVGINPRGATIAGADVDGALPEEMRRGCAFQLVPCFTDYAWEAMQGVVVQAELLSRHGYDAYAWSDQAVLRAAQYLGRLDASFGGWWASSDDAWQPWLINHAYGTSLPASSSTSPGKVLGFTDWVYGS